MQGSTDIPLNSRGRECAEETGKTLKNICFHHVITSGFIRSIETAELVTGIDRKEFITDPRVREISWGSWEGDASDGSDNPVLKISRATIWRILKKYKEEKQE